MKDNVYWAAFIDKHFMLKNLLRVDAVPTYLVVSAKGEVLFESSAFYLMEKFLKDNFEVHQQPSK